MLPSELAPPTAGAPRASADGEQPIAPTHPQAGAHDLPLVAMPQPNGARCGNCAASLYGGYCYACGQARVSAIRPLRELGADLIDSVLNLDGRLFGTLGALAFRPGRIAQEYLAGRRARWAPPFRTFIVLTALAFLLISVLQPSGGLRIGVDEPGWAIEQSQNPAELDRALLTVGAEIDAQIAAASASGSDAEALARLEADRSELLHTALERKKWFAQRDAALAAGQAPPPDPALPSIRFGGDNAPWHPTDNPVAIGWLPDAGNRELNQRLARLQRALNEVRTDPRRLTGAMLAKMPLALLILMPAFALVLKILYLPQRRLYAEHLVVALTSHAFLMLALIVAAGLGAIADLLGAHSAGAILGHAMLFALWTWVGVYLLLMQKRIYRQSWRRALVMFVLTGALYVGVLLPAALTAGAMIAMLSL